MYTMRYLVILLSLAFLLLPATAQLQEITLITDVDIKPIIRCDEHTIFFDKLEPVYIEQDCTKNISKDCGGLIYNHSILVTKNRTECSPLTKRIKFNNQTVNYEKDNMKCTIHTTYIICDDARGGDGNGDGICQSGETCHNISIKGSKLSEPIATNGVITIKPRTKITLYKSVEEVEITK